MHQTRKLLSLTFKRQWLKIVADEQMHTQTRVNNKYLENTQNKKEPKVCQKQKQEGKKKGGIPEDIIFSRKFFITDQENNTKIVQCKFLRKKQKWELMLSIKALWLPSCCKYVIFRLQTNIYVHLWKKKNQQVSTIPFNGSTKLIPVGVVHSHAHWAHFAKESRVKAQISIHNSMNEK